LASSECQTLLPGQYFNLIPMGEGQARSEAFYHYPAKQYINRKNISYKNTFSYLVKILKVFTAKNLQTVI
jgi:hypothetical protein